MRREAKEASPSPPRKPSQAIEVVFSASVGDLCAKAEDDPLNKEYGRVYKDAAEKEARLKIFEDNVKYVESFNASGNHGYTLGINEFSDLTEEEFLRIYTDPHVADDSD